MIVPVGSKGGFVPKQLPGGDRDAVLAEGIACYQTFIRGLLDLTDILIGSWSATSDIASSPCARCWLLVACASFGIGMLVIAIVGAHRGAMGLDGRITRFSGIYRDIPGYSGMGWKNNGISRDLMTPRRWLAWRWKPRLTSSTHPLVNFRPRRDHGVYCHCPVHPTKSRYIPVYPGISHYIPLFSSSCVPTCSQQQACEGPFRARRGRRTSG